MTAYRTHGARRRRQSVPADGADTPAMRSSFAITASSRSSSSAIFSPTRRQRPRHAAAVVGDEDGGQVSRPRTVPPARHRQSAARPGDAALHEPHVPRPRPSWFVLPRRTVTEDAVAVGRAGDVGPSAASLHDHDQGQAPASAAAARRGRSGRRTAPTVLATCHQPRRRGRGRPRARPPRRRDHTGLLFIGDAAQRGELGQVRGKGGVLEPAAVEPGVEAAERAGADAPSAPWVTAFFDRRVDEMGLTTRPRFAGWSSFSPARPTSANWTGVTEALPVRTESCGIRPPTADTAFKDDLPPSCPRVATAEPVPARYSRHRHCRRPTPRGAALESAPRTRCVLRGPIRRLGWPHRRANTAPSARPPANGFQPPRSRTPGRLARPTTSSRHRIRRVSSFVVQREWSQDRNRTSS